MRPRRWKLLLALVLGLARLHAADQEPAAILEIGAEPSWSLNGESSVGPALAVEFTPIENWLEIEAGVTPSFNHGSIEWSTDLLFKKPWTLSKKVELMVGLGPEWIRTAAGNAGAIEAALDFMFWPGAKHRVGWYVEPAYEYSFGRGHERSAGVSFGILIGIGRGG